MSNYDIMGETTACVKCALWTANFTYANLQTRKTALFIWWAEI